ncbi:MAG: aminotransferase class I/II-fold pyridoxal phosphate-dependent enzyme, partial [Muribaculaceae bacterium]|nr:aminotransferase class I/II-fold pyridoxal phosphate-dependent enzyme [Muribaculaceae bacterium]
TLRESGTFPTVPPDSVLSSLVDFSYNDYLGITDRADLHAEFLASGKAASAPFSSAASRLLARAQDCYADFESLLSSAYGRSVLTFNSGYHANSGLIPAITDSNTLILADRLVHASIIDGIMLSKCRFTRFRHNDIAHLEQLIKRERPSGDNILIVAESVYSMDGDQAPLEELIKLKKRYPGIVIYLDEAHALGVEGPRGLGLAMASSSPEAFDVVIGTLGKAAGSVGAFAAMSSTLRDVAVNKARSFIFSTALPPINIAWSTFILEKIFSMDPERVHLKQLSHQLSDGLATISLTPPPASHIQPYIVGDSHKAVALSRSLAEAGLKVLPIRTPTVPPGT